MTLGHVTELVKKGIDCKRTLVNIKKGEYTKNLICFIGFILHFLPVRAHARFRNVGNLFGNLQVKDLGPLKYT